MAIYIQATDIELGPRKVCNVICFSKIEKRKLSLYFNSEDYYTLLLLKLKAQCTHTSSFKGIRAPATVVWSSNNRSKLSRKVLEQNNRSRCVIKVDGNCTQELRKDNELTITL